MKVDECELREAQDPPRRKDSRSVTIGDMNTLWSRVYSEGFGSTTSSSKGEESAAGSPSVEPPAAESSDEHPSLQPAFFDGSYMKVK